MSQRIKGFVVALEEDIDEERAAVIRGFLGQIRGVVAVEAVAGTIDDQLVAARVRSDLMQQIYKVFYPCGR